MLQHRITINVANQGGQTQNVLKAADMKLPAKIIRWLFGDFKQVYLLDPGQTVQSVDVREIENGGKSDVKNVNTCK